MMAYHSISILAEGEGWGEIVPFLAFVAIAVISSIVKGMKEKSDARKAQEADGRHSMRMQEDDDTHSMRMKNTVMATRTSIRLKPVHPALNRLAPDVRYPWHD